MHTCNIFIRKLILTKWPSICTHDHLFKPSQNKHLFFTLKSKSEEKSKRKI